MRLIIIAGFSLLITPACLADFLAPTIGTFGWNRPTAADPYATFQAWETFSSVSGPNMPQTVNGVGTGDPTIVTYAPPASNFIGFGGPAGSVWPTVNLAGTPNAFNTGVGAFITSGGNIYSPGNIVSPRIIIPNNMDGLPGTNPNGFTTVLLQLRLLGVSFNPATMLIDDSIGGTPISPTSTTLLATQPLGGFGGTLFDHLIRFDLPGNADLYTINFAAAGSSMSLDRIAVDTYWNPIPEPGLLGIGTGVLLAACRCLLFARTQK